MIQRPVPAVSLLLALMLSVSTAAIGRQVVLPQFKGTTLTLMSFNVEWYGLGGDMTGKPADEYRDKTINEYVEIHAERADVMAFNEIVDVPRLKKVITGKGYQCESYEHNNSHHQHVVLCVNNKRFNLRPVNTKEGFAYQPVAMGKYRPLVYGILESKKGAPLAIIGAVHLKAQPDQGAIRLTQIRTIAKRFKAIGEDLPFILTGDFNTFGDEVNEMEGAFAKEGVDITPIEHPQLYTFRKGKMASKFDWIWASEGVHADAVTVGIPCNGPEGKSDKYASLTYYNENVSDHCPVFTKLQIP